MSKQLKEKIDRFRAIRRRIDSILMELSAPGLSNIAGLKIKAGELRSRLDHHLRTYGPDGEKLSVREAAVRRDMREEFERANNARKKAEKQEAALKAELDALKVELERSSLDCSADSYSALSVKAQESIDRIVSLEKILAERQEDLQALQKQESPLAELKVQRQELLANIAMGLAEKKDVDAIDAKIREAQSAENHRAVEIEDIKQAMAGLQSRIDAAQTQLQEQQGYLADAVSFVLFGRAVSLEAEYSDAAAKVGRTLEKIEAVRSLLDRHAPDSFPGRFIVDGIYQFSVPKVVLPGFPEDQKHPLNFQGLDIHQGIVSEQERLAALGVQA